MNGLNVKNKLLRFDPVEKLFVAGMKERLNRQTRNNVLSQQTVGYTKQERKKEVGVVKM